MTLHIMLTMKIHFIKSTEKSIFSVCYFTRLGVKCFSLCLIDVWLLHYYGDKRHQHLLSFCDVNLQQKLREIHTGIKIHSDSRSQNCIFTSIYQENRQALPVYLQIYRWQDKLFQHNCIVWKYTFVFQYISIKWTS